MRKIRFTIPRVIVGNASDTAWVSDGEDPLAELVSAAADAIATDLQIEVSGVTMFLAAWADPDHWAEDWVRTLGVEYDEVAAAVEALLAGAEEDAT